MLTRQQVANIIIDRCDEILEYEYGLGICGSGTAAYKAADDILALLSALPQPPVALAGEARKGQDAQRLDPKDDHATPIGGTPVKPSPELHPPMSVEEARETVEAINPEFGSAEDYIAFLHWLSAKETSPGGSEAFTAKASRIETALRTLQASGEVRT